MVAPPDRLPRSEPPTDAEVNAYLEQCAELRARLGAITLDHDPVGRDWADSDDPIDVANPEQHPLYIAFGDLHEGELSILPPEVATDGLEMWLWGHGFSVEFAAHEWPLERYMLYVAALNRGWTNERARRRNPAATIAAPERARRPAADTTTELRALPADRDLARLECDRLFHLGLAARVRS